MFRYNFKRLGFIY